MAGTVANRRAERRTSLVQGTVLVIDAVAALKSGAFDYLTKPLSLDQLRTLVKSALSLPQKPAAARSGEAQLLGSSPGIEQVRSMIEKLARSQAPVYITGESGSGKELAARLIHGKGSRRERAFVPVNCGAIPENLMESEFFGYKKGAFTGAEGDRDGFFQAANSGTLFLDEVADLPLAMQVKLLRAIQEKQVRKVGATSEDAVDVRIICATHQDLAAGVEAGKFRQDLYYRLAVIELKMPPLRECREDIPVLAEAILRRLSGSDGKRAIQLSPGAASSKWPLPDYLDRIEKEAIMEALEKTRFNRTAAAKLLGITFRALRYRMDRLGIR